MRFLAAKHLSVDEYYDVVIFGYLRAVMRYVSDSKLQQYRFSTIAWNCMNTDLTGHRRKNLRKKRQAETLSLHSIALDSCIAAGYGSQEYMESRLLLEDYYRRLSPAQREILWLRLQGNSIREIAKCKKIPKKNVQRLLEGAGVILKQLLKM